MNTTRREFLGTLTAAIAGARAITQSAPVAAPIPSAAYTKPELLIQLSNMNLISRSTLMASMGVDMDQSVADKRREDLLEIELRKDHEQTV